MDNEYKEKRKKEEFLCFCHNKGYFSHICDGENICKHGSEDLNTRTTGDTIPRTERMLQSYC